MCVYMNRGCNVTAIVYIDCGKRSEGVGGVSREIMRACDWKGLKRRSGRKKKGMREECRDLVEGGRTREEKMDRKRWRL